MSKNIFNSVQYPNVKTNTFDLSHDKKMSFRMGGLYPTLLLDCLPGDIVRLKTEVMLRFAPLVSPVMHRINVTTHYFFVPNRIVWPNWERWITGDLDVEPPTCSFATVADREGSLGDYMGLPTVFGITTHVSALPFACYEKIYSEYYRDQNLQEDTFEELVDGLNANYKDIVLGSVRKRSWMHDYFTSALPFAQKGDAVTLPLFTGDADIPIYANPLARPGQIVRDNSTGEPVSDMGALRAGYGDAYLKGGSDTPYAPMYIDPNGSMIARLEDVEAEVADINTLRRAFRLQEWLEKNARGGTRYIENIMAHFGVKSSDARLQRPEFLGGSYQRMVISEVLATAETDVPVGQMAGHGISVGSGNEFTYRCEEHGWIIGLINVQPVTAYQQGIPRMFSRTDRLDYAWPSFANIGEQEIKLKELYATGLEEQNESVFGYTPRYAEYKYLPSTVAGEMRSTLSHWHLGRIFTNTPNLNAQFIEANPSNRIFAVTEDVDHIYGHIFHSLKAVRKLPRFGTPTI